MRRLRVLPFAIFATACAVHVAAAPVSVDQARTGRLLPVVRVAYVERQFAHPPDDARIMMRWWWFGSAVEKAEIAKELRQMKDADIGGVEVQPVYPVVLDDPAHGYRNLPYLSDDFIDALRFAAGTARSLGMRIDITLGSGWPYGGPHTPVTLAAGMLRCDRVPVTPGTTSVPLPSLESGEEFIAAFLAQGDTRHFSPNGIHRITDIQNGRLQLTHDLSGEHVVLFFVSSRTGQQVKRAAVDAEGFVLNHYDRTAIETHLHLVGDRLMQAFGDHPPYAVFSDSLEVYNSNWTPDLLEEFKKRRGYDLTPYLPALVGDIGAKTADIRHDWGETLTELANERYLTPIREWAHSHGTRFRSQTYGVPPVILSSNALVDLPEGEGYQWRQFTATRWASSASHLYGRPVTSSETWTWLHSPVFRATPLDMKAEADRHFLEGINQLIGHGWPYSPPQAGEPGWRFYAAAVFNAHNPWFIVMPEIAQYLQRISYLLRQGNPVEDVAVYLPTDDAWSNFTGAHVSVNQQMNELLGPQMIPQILDAGYNFDFIDDQAISKLGIQYPIVVLPKLKRMPEATKQKLEQYKRQGGIVIDCSAIGEMQELGKRLNSARKPDFAAANSAIGFIHRKLSDGDIYFVVNTGNQPVHTVAHARVSEPGRFWDPFTGREDGPSVDPSAITLDLAPYESRVVVFGEKETSTGVTNTRQHHEATVDIGSDWKVTFDKSGNRIEMKKLHSWNDDAATRYYSGTATYEKTVEVPTEISSADEVFLDFGPGTVTQLPPGRLQGFRAQLDSPVREAALVYVNGKLAGSVWHPPYRVDVKRLLQPSQNQFRIVVGNLATNELAGQATTRYRLLDLRFAPPRFQAQDMQDIKSEPAGILGTIRLVAK